MHRRGPVQWASFYCPDSHETDSGSRGVNDPGGRDWGQTGRAGGGSFTPRLHHQPELTGRHKTPPVRGAVPDLTLDNPMRANAFLSSGMLPAPASDPDLLARREVSQRQNSLPGPIFCDCF